MKAKKTPWGKFDPPSITVVLTVDNQDAGNMVICHVPKDDASWDNLFKGMRRAIEKRLKELEDKKSLVTDWQYEVANGDTRLGYKEWLIHRYESE